LTIEFHEDLDRAFQAFDDRVQDKILAKMIALQKEAPNLGRPHADTLNGSAHFQYERTSRQRRRAHLAHFDHARSAILLAACDNRGANEDRI